MAKKRFTDFPKQEAMADDDLLLYTDIDDTTASPNGTSKSTTPSGIVKSSRVNSETGADQPIDQALDARMRKSANLSDVSDPATARTSIDVVETDKVTQRTSSTGAAEIPYGTSAERPVSPVYGYTRGNTDINALEWWNGVAWEPVGSGARGNNGDQIFVENDQTVTSDYTIPANKNAMSTGPITIADNVTVTVSDGARWVVI